MVPIGLTRDSILLADDEEFSRSIVARMLRSLGCKEPHAAGDGRQALALLESHGKTIPLSIVDFNMPEVNGLQLLKLIRTGRTGAPNSHPVVMLTGSSDRGLVGAALALDVDAFLVKPVSKAMLAARLEKVLSEAQEVKPPAAYESVDIDSVSRGLLSRKPVGQPLSSARKTGTRSGGGLRVKLEEVPEGAVLAEDIRGRDNELLLGNGTPLNARFLRRLKELSTVEYVSIRPPERTGA